MFEEIESDNAVANAAKVNNSSMCRLPSVIRASIIFASVIVVVMMFASDIDGMVTIHSRLVQELQPSIFEGYFIAA